MLKSLSFKGMINLPAGKAGSELHSCTERSRSMAIENK